MTDTHLTHLRDDLISAGFFADKLLALFGNEAESARQRGVLEPVRRALRSGVDAPLSALIRLFLLGEQLSARELEEALPTLGAKGAAELGLIDSDTCDRDDDVHDALDHGTVCRAALSLNPVEVADSVAPEPQHWWVISDLDDHLRRSAATPDHVMGVGGATRSLIAQLPSANSDLSLDLGTGCGIVAMHLARRGDVIATDISERAIMIARMNAVLNGVESRIEFRLGNLYEPVATETFTLIASNPPFVITPRSKHTGPKYVYRDGGMTGDHLAQAAVVGAPELLSEGGTFVCLGNWEYQWGKDGLARVNDWLDSVANTELSFDAWVIERDRVSPLHYAETWVRDGGTRSGDERFELMMTTWLDDFSERRVVSIGLGAIHIRRVSAGEKSVTRLESATGQLAAHELGNSLSQAFSEAVRAERMTPEEVLGSRWVASAHTVEERDYTPGAADPRSIRLVIPTPIGRRFDVDPMLAAAVGACDGELTLGQIAEALASLLDLELRDCSDRLVEGVRDLTWFGVLASA